MYDREVISGSFPALKRVILTSILFIIGLSAGSKPLIFNVVDYRAKGDGQTLNTKYIQAAIDACSKSGGGTVLFPAGRYISGTIYLKSHVTLFLEAGAVLEGSKNLEDYPVTVSKIRSYTDNYTDKSLIYGEDLEQTAITGYGTIDGNGGSFEHNGPYKVRPYLIRIINCRKIQVQDISIINSPMWVQHYLACEDVSIRGITVNSRVNANNDGIDIDGCTNVRISDCNIISGDDAIVLKSTLDKPCKNVTVTNCVLRSDCNAFKLGTETNGGFQDIVFSNSTIYDTHLAGITLQLVDGGSLERVSVSNITMNSVGTAIFIRLGSRARQYGDGSPKPGMGKLAGVIIDNIQGTKIGRTGCSVSGLPGFPAGDIILSNICLTFEGGGKTGDTKREIPEMEQAYPEFEMFGTLPSYGFYCRHCRNLSFSNIQLGFEKPDARPAIVCGDVSDLKLSGIKAVADTAAPVIQFRGVKDAMVQSCKAYKGTGTFLQLTGRDNMHITLTGNDLGYCGKPVDGENSPAVFMDANRLPPLYGLPEGRYVNCGMQYTDDRQIRIHSPAEIQAMRKKIIGAIWGTDRLPDRSDVFVTTGIKSPLSPDAALSRVDRFEIPVSAPTEAGSAPVRDLAYFFVPVKRNNRLVMLNPGHSCTIKESPESNYRIESAINGLLKAGFDVLAVFMPHVSEAGCNLDHCSIINTSLGPGIHPSTYGLRFFLEPEIVSLNYLLLTNNYRDINMAGLSGGGWTTNLLSAIDERIKYSFSVAGSMPLYYRSDASMGDIEQFLPALYRDIAGYPELYVLGAYGKGRKQVQILNRNDDCCFGQKQHDQGRNYDSDLRTFELSVKEKLTALEASDHYYLVIDETAAKHQISDFACKNIILKELLGK